LQLASALGTRIAGHRLELTVNGIRLHDAIGPALAFSSRRRSTRRSQ
jgi:hypothetical protein